MEALPASQSTPALLSLPLFTSTQSLPLVRFSPGQSIAVFSAPLPDGSAEREQEWEERVQEEGLCTVHWNSILWNKCTRKLVDQSHALFMDLQEVESQPHTVLPYSKQYRAALRECVLGLNKILDEQMFTDEEEEKVLSDQSSLYSMLELAWHLCEILFVEVLPGGCLVHQLLEWVRWHNKYTDDIVQAVLESPHPDSNDNYWNAVYGLVLQGRVKETLELLSHLTFCRRHPEVHSSITELLRRMPMVHSPVGRSRVELRTGWTEWKSECVRRREQGIFSGCPQLYTLSGLLCGEESCFREQSVIDSCDQWYVLMVGRLLYCSPLIINSDYELQYIAQECTSLYHNGGDVDEYGIFDQLLLAALQNNMIDTLKLGSSMLSNWWFVAHLSNLLHRCGVLVVSQLEFGNRLTEFVLAEYATSLMGNSSLWNVALDYFSHCPVHGRAYIMAYIERVPLVSEYKALKVLRACNKYKLKEQALSVCKVMAVKGYHSQRLGVALTWCIRAKDSAFAAFIAEKYFDNYQNLGEFKDLDLLDHLESAMLLSPRLAFLGKYREFHIKYCNGYFTSAAQLLVTLLCSHIVPKKYRTTILVDALPLLELKDQVLFSDEQTKALMQFLIDNDEEKDGDEDDDENSDQKFRVPLLQFALLRNFYRAGQDGH